MTAYPKIRMKVEICTPPASSPECPPMSPMPRSCDTTMYSQAPHGLGLYGYSDAESSIMMYPVSPPDTDQWMTQAESVPSATTMCSEPHLPAWTSTAFDDLHAVSTSSMSWETPVAFQGTTVSYPPYSVQATHALQPQQPSICSPFGNETYGVDEPPRHEAYNVSTLTSAISSPHQVDESPYLQEPMIQSTPYGDLYASHYPSLAPPRVEITDGHSVSLAVSVGTLRPNESTNEQDQARNFRSSSAPGQNDSTVYSNPMSQVARVRRPRRRTLTPSSTVISCPICGLQFDRTYNCKEHIKTHNPERERPHTCPHRGCKVKPFTRQNDLERHIGNVHEKRKDHKCGYCHNSFGRKDTLRRHMEDGCQMRKQAAPRPKPVKSRARVNAAIRARATRPSAPSTSVATSASPSNATFDNTLPSQTPSPLRS